MSANNIIILNLKTLTVTHKDIEHTDCCYEEKECKTLAEAIDKAYEIQEKESPEYGVLLKK